MCCEVIKTNVAYRLVHMMDVFYTSPTGRNGDGGVMLRGDERPESLRALKRRLENCKHCYQVCGDYALQQENSICENEKELIDYVRDDAIVSAIKVDLNGDDVPTLDECITLLTDIIKLNHDY